MDMKIGEVREIKIKAIESNGTCKGCLFNYYGCRLGEFQEILGYCGYDDREFCDDIKFVEVTD